MHYLYRHCCWTARSVVVIALAGCAANPPASGLAVAPASSAATTTAAVPVLPPPPSGIDETASTYIRATVDPESSMPTVGGWIRVHASLADAYKQALRFGEIKELDPDIEQSTVVDIHPAIPATDVYLRIPTYMHEYVWAVVRFRPVATGPDPKTSGYACRGDEVQGNLDDLRISWRLVPVGPDETLAQIELLADPKLPLPRAWLIPQLRDGVRGMLTRFRRKAEGGSYDDTL